MNHKSNIIIASLLFVILGFAIVICGLSTIINDMQGDTLIFRADNILLEIKVTEYEMKLIAVAYKIEGRSYKNDPVMISLYNKWQRLNIEYGNFYNDNIDKLQDKKYNIWE